jgi:DNA-binding CsgD family transcriptional regulator
MPVIALTRREAQILRMLADGYDRADIAARLRTSLGTIKADTGGLYAKLGARTAAQAVHNGHQAGHLGGPDGDLVVVQCAREMGYRIALAPLAGGAR